MTSTMPLVSNTALNFNDTFFNYTEYDTYRATTTTTVTTTEIEAPPQNDNNNMNRNCININFDFKNEICQICGSNVSIGLHFGAVTCEACKKFFVRYLNNQNVNSVCKRKTEDCVITMKTRADCFFCRLKKCFQVGMDVNNKSVKMQSYKDIQCQVCLAPSSGTHFGVITCEACKLKCPLNGKCQISKNGSNRSLCPACRMSRCLGVGMNLTKSKVGRQSNLVKRNMSLSIIKKNNSQNSHQLMDTTGNKRFKQANLSLQEFNFNSNDSLNAMNTLNEPHSSSHTIMSNQQCDYSTYSSYDNFYNLIDNKIDQNQNNLSFSPMAIVQSTNKLIRKNDFEDTIDVLNSSFMLHLNSMPNGFDGYKMGHDLENIINFLTKHAESYVNYCERVESLSTLPPDDRKQLTLNSVHSIRYLWLHKQNKNLNYFNLDNENYLNIIAQIFPIFQKADTFFKKLHDTTIRNLSLDSKEFSLFSRLIIFVGGKLYEFQTNTNPHLTDHLCDGSWDLKYFQEIRVRSGQCVFGRQWIVGI